MLHEHTPNMFPMGYQGTSVMDVLSTMLNENTCGILKLTCPICTYCIPQYDLLKNVMHIEHLFKKPDSTIEIVLGLNGSTEIDYDCASCGAGSMLLSAFLSDMPDIWAFGIYTIKLNLKPKLELTINNTIRHLRLRGIIYVGQFHFTSRLFKENGSIWYHDGQTTGRSCTFEGYLQNLENTNSLLEAGEGFLKKMAVSVIYA